MPLFGKHNWKFFFSVSKIHLASLYTTQDDMTLWLWYCFPMAQKESKNQEAKTIYYYYFFSLYVAQLIAFSWLDLPIEHDVHFCSYTSALVWRSSNTAATVTSFRQSYLQRWYTTIRLTGCSWEQTVFYSA